MGKYFFQGDKKLKLPYIEEKDKKPNELLDDFSSKLAVIIYDDNIALEWLGAEEGKKEDFENIEKYAVFSFEDKKINNIITEDENKKSVQPKLREIIINKINPFSDLSREKGKAELIKQSPGSPLYYKDYHNGAFVIAIINENFEFQYFDKNTMIFLMHMINKGRLIRKRVNKGIDEDNVIQLDLHKHSLGPSDGKYLIKYDLKNLRFLDLSDNSLKSKGAFYLSQGKFSSLRTLNLNNNSIGDEGLNHIAYGFFCSLDTLHICNNNIKSIGIKFLVKAEFVNNLIILSLSENRKIGDEGIGHMKEHKGWEALKKLNLDYTGLTDIALDYLTRASMPKLENLNIIGNKFTEVGNSFIYTLRMNHIKVNYQKGENEKIPIGDYIISV